MVIADAIQDADLFELGKAVAGQALVCGGSGIALGLPANFGHQPQVPQWQSVAGPGVVISGSCSRATRGQVDRFRSTHPAREVTAEEAVSGAVSAAELAGWVLDQDEVPVIYSSAEPEVLRAAQERLGRDVAASAIEGLFQVLAATLSSRGVTWIVVAGGETSGAVVNGLGADVLEIGPRIAPGVPVMRTGNMALALKSGNFGGPDFFAEALTIMETDQ